MQPSVTRLDHLVLTVSDLSETVAFYTNVMGMRHEMFSAAGGGTRHALRFGEQKINLHIAGKEFEPKAKMPAPGTADLCFVTEHAIDDWVEKLSRLGAPVIEGPVPRTGALGPVMSIYIRDPDLNLIEIARYDKRG